MDTQDDLLRRDVWLAAERARADLLMDQNAASAYIGVSPRTMERWRAERTGPPFIRLSVRAIRYSRAAIVAWIAGRTVRESE
ncbi:MAG: helix-turn-helix domain-containing protein [Candidatus Binataceae bacterium]|jgi:predicted DNA-binding transcriptional regulator AlpA